MATGTVRGMKARLDLKKIEQEDTIEVIAVVTTKDGPLKEVQLVFSLNAYLIGEMQETDPFGRVAIAIDKPLASGNYEVFVQAIDGDLKESVGFAVKKPRKQTEEEKEEFFLQHQLNVAKLHRELEEAKKRPEEKTLTPEPELLPDWFDGHEVGAPGRPKFVVSVYTTGKDGKRRGCRGRVKVVEKETGKEFIFYADEHGDATYPGPNDPPIIQQEDCAYLMRVGGVEREEMFKKEAPPRYKPAHLGRVAFCWFILMIWVIVHFSVVGVGESAAEKKIRAYQEYQAMNEQDRFYYEETRRLLGKPLPQRPSIMIAEPQELFPFESTAWWLWLGWCMAYTLINFLKMFSRAWTRVQRTISERRAGVPEYLGRPQSQGQGNQQTQATPSEPSYWRGTWRELWKEFIAEFAVHEVRRRIS